MEEDKDKVIKLATKENEKKKESAENIQKFIGQMAAQLIPEAMRNMAAPITVAEVELIKFFCEKDLRDFDKIEEDYKQAIRIILEGRKKK